MDRTKEKILAAALKLFNDQGVAKTALRAIADDVGISVGNLQYHFKKREDIIESLYHRIVRRIDDLEVDQEIDPVGAFFGMSTQIMILFYEHRFFLLDFIAITRSNGKIRGHYAVLSKKREDQFVETVSRLVESGFLRKAELRNEYRTLYRRIEVISNFWFSSQMIQSETLTEQAIEDYIQVIGQGVYPYLTSHAKQHYLKSFPGQKS